MAESFSPITLPLLQDPLYYDSDCELDLFILTLNLISEEQVLSLLRLKNTDINPNSHKLNKMVLSENNTLQILTTLNVPITKSANSKDSELLSLNCELERILSIYRFINDYSNVLFECGLPGDITRKIMTNVVYDKYHVSSVNYKNMAHESCSICHKIMSPMNGINSSMFVTTEYFDTCTFETFSMDADNICKKCYVIPNPKPFDGLDGNIFRYYHETTLTTYQYYYPIIKGLVEICSGTVFEKIPNDQIISI